MYHYALSVILVLLALAGWIGIQQLARRFAERHPQSGPYREEGAGCSLGCRCSGATCRRNAG